MNDADLVKQINDSLSPGYEVCGYGRLEEGDYYIYGSSEVHMWGVPALSDWKYVKVRKSFVWPEWLKGQAIAKDESGDWYCYPKTPRSASGAWVDGGNWMHLDTDILDLTLPEVDYKDSLILNPNHPENKA